MDGFGLRITGLGERDIVLAGPLGGTLKGGGRPGPATLSDDDDRLAPLLAGDILMGDSGADLLVNGPGPTRMTGGDGGDRFLFRPEVSDAVALADILEPETTLTTAATTSSPIELNRWIQWQVGRGGAVGIDDEVPRDGEASVHLRGDDTDPPIGAYSAGIAQFWEPEVGPVTHPDCALPSTLGGLDRLAYDWFRDGSSTNGEVEAPALRLHVDADGDAATDDRAILIYEPVFNTGGPAATDAWQTVQLEGEALASAHFWMLEPGVGLDRVLDRSLGEWLNGDHSEGFAQLGPESLIEGIDLSIGDGWFGDFSGAVDKVGIGFHGEALAWNFEEPRADIITDFESGRDVLDLGLILDTDTGGALDAYLQADTTAEGTTLVSLDVTGSGERHLPLVELKGSGIDLASDIVLEGGEPVVA